MLEWIDSVCVYVIISFVLDVRLFVDVPAGVTQEEEGHTGFLHPSFCGVCLSFSIGNNVCMCVCMYVTHTYSKSIDQPCKVANPARGQLNNEYFNISLSAFAPENLVSRDGFGSLVPRQPCSSPCSG